MTFDRGDDVVVSFGDLDHPGEVISQSSGYVMVRINLDTQADYGSISSRLDPQPTVCVKESKVRHVNTYCNRCGRPCAGTDCLRNEQETD